MDEGEIASLEGEVVGVGEPAADSSYQPAGCEYGSRHAHSCSRPVDKRGPAHCVFASLFQGELRRVCGEDYFRGGDPPILSKYARDWPK